MMKEDARQERCMKNTVLSRTSLARNLIIQIKNLSFLPSVLTEKQASEPRANPLAGLRQARIAKVPEPLVLLKHVGSLWAPLTQITGRNDDAFGWLLGMAGRIDTQIRMISERKQGTTI